MLISLVVDGPLPRRDGHYHPPRWTLSPTPRWILISPRRTPHALATMDAATRSTMDAASRDALDGAALNPLVDRAPP